MQFGLFTEFEWMAGHSEQEAFCTSLAQIDEAERLGFASVWLGEIHFQKGRSVLPSPLLVGSAVAQRTRRVTVGLAVNVLPLGHPLRLAEDVATLDHLTHGRLEYGIGRSGLPSHYGGFNIPMCWMNAGSRLTQEQVLRSMRLFAAEVMPAFPHRGDDAHRADQRY